MSLKLGQRIQVDLSGMRIAGALADASVEGTVVELGPGVVTVLLLRDDGRVSRVTVGPRRIERAA